MPDESIWEPTDAERELMERLQASVEQAVEANDTTSQPDASPEAPEPQPSGPPPQTAVPDDEVPPDPAFLIIEGRCYLPDNTPVGVWLHNEHHDLTGAQVEALLLDMGLDPANANAFCRQRELMIRTKPESLSPGMQGLANAEQRHESQTRAVREAFIAAQRKKQ